MNVIASNVQDDHSWMIRQHQPIGEVIEVRSLERINPTVHDHVIREVLGHRFPTEKLGIAQEQDGVLRRRIGAIRSFVSLHIFLEAMARDNSCIVGLSTRVKNECE